MITPLILSLALQDPAPVKDLIEVCLSDRAEQQLLTQSIDDVDDHVAPVRDAGCWRVRAYATDEEQALLESMGLQVFVLQEDLSAYYEARAAEEAGIVAGAGSMGGFRTLAEINQELDRLTSAYPTFVSPKFSLGSTHEGRPIYAVRISDQPTIDDPFKPVVWYDALHHAREPMGGESLLLFADHVLSQAASGDEGALRLLETRQLIFIPCCNPDGYEYNRQIAPGGGGLWRKNRRNNGGGAFGVDLNRNYDYEWGPQWGGSSGSTTSETYRGPSAGSEPEIQALVSFMATHPPVFSVSAHTYSDMWLFPWSYDEIVTPDDAYLRAFAEEFSAPGWVWGPPWEILYDANGTNMDYHYGVHGCLAYSPEIGGNSDGFWPSPSAIPGLFAEVLPAYLAMAERSGGWLESAGAEAVELSGDGDGDPEAGEQVEVLLDISNRGLSFVSGTVTLSSQSPELVVLNATASLSVSADSTVSVSGLTASIQPTAPSGLYTVTLALDYEGFTSYEEVNFTVGSPRLLLRDDFERGGAGWAANNSTNWSWERAVPEGTTSGGNTVQPSGGNPGGSGGACWVTGASAGSSVGVNDVDGTARLVSPRLDLSAHDSARLGYARWFSNLPGSPTDDEFVCEVSADDGATWQELERVEHRGAWEEPEFELTDHISLTDSVRLRFTVADDPNNDLTEGLVDDLSITTISNDPTLSWYGATTAGDVIRLFLDGEPGASWALFWSMDAAPGVPGGGFSSGFQLSGGVRVMRSGVLDASGLAELKIQVPLGSNLAGSTVSAQASVQGAGAPSWTNVIQITLE